MTDHAASTSEAPAGPPPGWYNDPHGAPTLRWWDGRSWTAHTQPPSGGAPPVNPVPQMPGLPAAAHHVARASRPGPWAWAVAATPFAGLAAAVILAALTGPAFGTSACVTIGYFTGGILAFIAALMDVRSLRAAGDPIYPGMAGLCFLLSGWAYLLARAIKRRTGADWGVFAAGLGAAVVVLAVAIPVAGGAKTSNEVFNQSGVQAQIAQAIKAKTGDTVTVACPEDPPMNPGSSFDCIATAPDNSTAAIKVTIQDNSGDYIWQAASS